LETTIAGPSALRCHCQATQETENVGNLIRCLAVPFFFCTCNTHTHRKISVEHLRLGSVPKHRVAQTFLTVSHSDMSDLVKSNKGF